MISDKLKSKLLARGGQSVDEEITGWPEYLDILLSNGKSGWASRWFDPKKLGVIEFLLLPKRCHDNVLLLVSGNPRLKLYTGFVLSGEGVWRNHTWGIYAKHHIIETTVRGSLYFGTEIPKEVCESEVQGLKSECCKVIGLPENIDELFSQAVAQTLWECAQCGIPKSLADFRIQKTGHLRVGQCKECGAEETQTRRDKNPELHREIQRVSRIKQYHANPEKFKARRRKYYHDNPARSLAIGRNCRLGITPEQQKEMLQTQKNCCASCGDVFSKTPCIDHDHITGKVRAFLCGECNKGIGHLQDSSLRCFLAASYLQKFGS